MRIKCKNVICWKHTFSLIWTINSCEKQLKDKNVRKTNTRKCLACSAWLLAYLKLSKKMARPWIGSANFIFYLFLLCPVSSETVLYRCFKEYFSLKISKNFTRKLLQFYYKLAGQRKRGIRSKKDLWPFNRFQTKPLRKSEMSQKLLLLKVWFTKVIKPLSYFFCDSAF